MSDDPMLERPVVGRRAHHQPRPHRPIRLPGDVDARPNYALRRAVVGGCAVLVLLGVGAVVVGATRGDDAASVRSAEPGAPQAPVAIDGSAGSLVAEDAAPVTAAVGSSAAAGTAIGAIAATATGAGSETTPTTAPAMVGPRLPADPNDGFQEDTVYVALYGTPGSTQLGIMGEYEVDGAIEKAREVAAGYEPYAGTIVPSFEIISSVASFEAGPDGDYSNELSIERLRPWVEGADEAGMAVVLDLQAGRARFDEQVREFEELLIEPHVGVALDPEWRVGDDQRPQGGKIGSVTAAEVNRTIEYVAGLVRRHHLPPKMLIVHQFDDSMIQDKTDIIDVDEVQVIIHMDGFGSLMLKNGSYERVVRNLPAGSLPGWKNFYDEDRPTPTPAETMEREPMPIFISFQ